jgi:protein-S-isoprenylcysteine O-methyltransferase Ste14
MDIRRCETHMMGSLERGLLAAVFLLYCFAAFIWPVWRVWRQTGHNPYVLPSGDDAYGYVAQGFRICLLGLAAYVLVQAIWPAIDNFSGALAWLVDARVRILGWSGLIFSLVWTVIAQYQMGKSWRVGIDFQQRTALVTSGIFGHTRNPIFLGMRISLVSLMFLLPNALTLALWIAADILIQLQVRLEETFLEQQHGNRYAKYRAKVRRWF